MTLITIIGVVSCFILCNEYKLTNTDLSPTEIYELFAQTKVNTPSELGGCSTGRRFHLHGHGCDDDFIEGHILSPEGGTLHWTTGQQFNDTGNYNQDDSIEIRPNSSSQGHTRCLTTIAEALLEENLMSTHNEKEIITKPDRDQADRYFTEEQILQKNNSSLSGNTATENRVRKTAPPIPPRRQQRNANSQTELISKDDLRIPLDPVRLHPEGAGQTTGHSKHCGTNHSGHRQRADKASNTDKQFL